LATGGKGMVAKLAQKTIFRKAVANNEKMSIMIAGKTSQGATTSAKMGYKTVGAAISGAGSSVSASTTCAVSRKAN